MSSHDNSSRNGLGGMGDIARLRALKEVEGPACEEVMHLAKRAGVDDMFARLELVQPVGPAPNSRPLLFAARLYALNHERRPRRNEVSHELEQGVLGRVVVDFTCCVSCPKNGRARHPRNVYAASATALARTSAYPRRAVGGTPKAAWRKPAGLGSATACVLGLRFCRRALRAVS